MSELITFEYPPISPGDVIFKTLDGTVPQTMVNIRLRIPEHMRTDEVEDRIKTAVEDMVTKLNS